MFDDQFIESGGVSCDILSRFRDWSITNSWLDSCVRLLTVLIAPEGILCRLDMSSRLPFLNASYTARTVESDKVLDVGGAGGTLL